MKRAITLTLMIGVVVATLSAQSNVAEFRQLFLSRDYASLFGPLLDYASSLAGNSSFEVDYMMGMTLCNSSGFENDGRAYLRQTQRKFPLSAQIFNGRRVSVDDAITNCSAVAGVATGEAPRHDAGVHTIMKANIDIRSQQQILDSVKTRKAGRALLMSKERPAHIARVNAVAGYDGSYSMVHDGWKGELILRGAGGDYVDSAGKRYPVRTRLFPGNKIVFYIVGLGGENADGTGGQKFEAYLFTQTRDGMAGMTWWQAQPFGFYAVRK
jgi:hypothetical protein